MHVFTRRRERLPDEAPRRASDDGEKTAVNDTVKKWGRTWNASMEMNR